MSKILIETATVKLVLEALEKMARLTSPLWALENNYAGHLEAITALKALAEQPAPAPGYCKNCKDYTVDAPLAEQPAPVQEPLFWYRPAWEREREVMIALEKLAEQPAQQEPDKHQEYIDSLPHDPDSEAKMLTQIYHWARQSYSRHQQSVRGQMITDADSSNNHIIWAALRWAKENPSPQAQQEPVARIDSEPSWDGALGLYRAEVTLTKKLGQFTDLYTTPQAQRKPLTDEQIDAVRNQYPPSAGIDFDARCREFARAIEAAHNIKEKNT